MKLLKNSRKLSIAAIPENFFLCMYVNGHINFVALKLCEIVPLQTAWY